MAKYWLLDWMDSEGVKNLVDAERVLASSGAISRLGERAVLEREFAMKPIPEASEQLVAGTGLDLSGAFDCGHRECISNRVDQLIRRTWHFFDHVVAVGLDPSGVIRGLRLANGEASVRQRRKLLLTHISVALHVRNIGAEKFILFTSRPPYCNNHIDARAEELGLAPPSVLTDKLEEMLRDGGRMIYDGVEYGKQVYSFTHAKLKTLESVSYELTDHINRRREIDKWAKDYAESYGKHLLADAMLAQVNNAALGRAALVDDEEYQPKRVNPTVGEAAFDIALPFVENLPIRELLAIREHEAADYQAFRIALRSAIKSRVVSMPDADAGTVAGEIADDVLEPALVELDRKLSRAGDTLSRRSLASLAIGTTVTTVGLLTLAPLVVAGIVLGAGGLLTSYNEYLKDQKEIKLSDMHFLWHLTNRADRYAG